MASANIFIGSKSEEEIHNQLMTSFCCDYFAAESWEKKFEKFKLKSFVYLKTPAERCVSKPHEVWDELERKGLLGPNNYTVLRELVTDIDDELTYVIEDAEDKVSSLKGEEYNDIEKRKNRRQRGEADIESIKLHSKATPYTVDFYRKGEDITVEIFRKKLHKINLNEAQRVPVSPLQKTSRMAMEDIFAPVCIREDLEYSRKGLKIGMQDKLTKPIHCPDDMLYIDGDIARNVFMLGQAAIGKSVFCLRMIENWCKAHDPNSFQNSNTESSNVWVRDLTKYDFLFFVQLRHVFKSRTSVSDMICNDVFQHHPGYHDVIRHVISSDKYKCLCVIDGLDEWKITDEAKNNLKVDGMPNTENMANCTFLWSLRPWIMDRFSDTIRANDRVVEIQGLDFGSVSTVIEKILVNIYKLDKTTTIYKNKFEMIKKKSNDSKLKSIMEVPLMAIACVQIWYKETDFGNSMTSLYIALLDLLIKRSYQKSPLSLNLRNKLFQKYSKQVNLPTILASTKSIKEFFPVILRLGKVAYEDLFASDTHLVFGVEDLENVLGTDELNIALHIGLLSKCEAPGSCNEENVSLNFFHKSVQEFLAAIYIETCDIKDDFYKHLTKIEIILEVGNVLIFLSGLNRNKGSSISRYIVERTHSDADLIRYREHKDVVLRRNIKAELLYRLQFNCYTEMLFAKSQEIVTNNPRGVFPRLCKCISSTEEDRMPFHVSDVFLKENEGEKIRGTVDFISNHYADIRSIFLQNIRTDVENGIPNSLLIKFLDETMSLQSLDISASKFDRKIYKISDIFSSLTALTLYGVTIPSDAMKALQTALKSNKAIRTLGLVNIACRVDEVRGRTPASLSGLIQMLPELPSLSILQIKITNNDDKPVFHEALKHSSHLHGLLYIWSYPSDDEYDRDVLRTVCKWTQLHWLHLFSVNLGDSGLRLSSNMLQIEAVMLRSVNMSSAGWEKFIKSVIAVKHKLYIYVDDNTDIKSVQMVKTSSNFKVIYEKQFKDGIMTLTLLDYGPFL